MFPIIPAASAADSGNTNGIFYGGSTAPSVSTGVSNIVSDTGILQSDVAAVTGAGDVQQKAGCEYGADKGIHFGGHNDATNPISITNLVSNLGVMSADVAGVAGVTARRQLAGCDFGGDKGIFGFGDTSGSPYLGMSNLVSNAGVVASDVAAVGTARESVAACEYSGNKDKGIFFGGQQTGGVKESITNLISNLGVVQSDTATAAGVTDVANGAGCSYGGDKGIFGFGHSGAASVGKTNLVSNAGVVAADVTAVGTARYYVGACEYGGDKGIFFAGEGGKDTSNQVSDTGVVQSDVTGVGTARHYVSGCSWG